MSPLADVDLECAGRGTGSANSHALVEALKVFTPTLRHLRCVEDAEYYVLGNVSNRIKTAFGASSLGSESVTDTFIKRRSLEKASGTDNHREWRLDNRRDALKDTLEFGGRMVDEARRNGDFGAMEEFFLVLGPLKGLLLIRED